MKDHIKKKLIEIVGPNSYSDRLIDRIAYSYDGSNYSSRPDGAIWVSSAEQISHEYSLCPLLFALCPNHPRIGSPSKPIPRSHLVFVDNQKIK